MIGNDGGAACVRDFVLYETLSPPSGRSAEMYFCHNNFYTKEINEIFHRLGYQERFDDKIMFEFYYCFYTIFHLFVQYFNIYKTEFYAYNFSLFFFSAIFLSKRLLFQIWLKYKINHPIETFNRKILQVSIIAVLCLNELYFCMKAFYRYSIASTFCLFYPYMKI